MVSIRALLFNLSCYLVFKPLFRFASYRVLTRVVPRLMEWGDPKPLPRGVRAQPVTGERYIGEWLRIGNSPTGRVILALPGGGFIMRPVKVHREYQARFCAVAVCDALIVHYRLAPETPFPGGLEDCVAAYEDLLRQGYAPNDITIAGESAGGGLTLSVLMVLRDRGLPMPGGSIIVSALGDLTFSGDSRRRNWWRDSMLVNRRNSNMHQMYIGNADPHQPYLSPVLASFDRFPPMYGIAGRGEILLDDTVRAFDQARKAGVHFVMEIWDWMPHGFTLFGFIPESRVVIERMAEFVNKRRLQPLPRRYGSFEEV